MNWQGNTNNDCMTILSLGAKCLSHVDEATQHAWAGDGISTNSWYWQRISCCYVTRPWKPENIPLQAFHSLIFTIISGNAFGTNFWTTTPPEEELCCYFGNIMYSNGQHFENILIALKLKGEQVNLKRNAGSCQTISFN